MVIWFKQVSNLSTHKIPPVTFCKGSIVLCFLSLFSSYSSSSAQHTVIEGQTHHSLLMAAVFPLDFSSLYTPQTSQVVWRGCWKKTTKCHIYSHYTLTTLTLKRWTSDWPVTIYCESPEKAQSHIQPLDVSPGLLLLILSSVMSEKFDVLQILQVWSAEQVANSLGMT